MIIIKCCHIRKKDTCGNKMLPNKVLLYNMMYLYDIYVYLFISYYIT